MSAIAEEVVRTQLADPGLERIISEPATDSEGNEALHLTLVLRPEAASRLTGDEALDLLVGIQQKLQAEGEERFPIIEYATEEELASENGESDSDGDEDQA